MTDNVSQDDLNINQVFDIVKSLGIRVGKYDEYSGHFLGQDFVEASIVEPNFPSHIEGIDNKQLGELLHCQSEWAGHLDERLAEYSAQLRLTDELKDRIESRLLLDAGQGKAAYKKLEAKASPEYTEVVARVSILKSIIELIKAALSKAERRHVSLSRQISLRGQEYNKFSIKPAFIKPPEEIPAPTTTVAAFSSHGRKIVRSP